MDVAIPCPCPAKADGSPRHEQDTVTLFDKLDFRQASTVRNAVLLAKQEDPGATAAQILTILTDAYLTVGIASWTLQDAQSKRLPVTRSSITEYLLADLDTAMTVGDAADGLYAPVMVPLVLRAFAPSQPSPTRKSTSPTNGSPRKRPTPLRPSSTTTTPTDATEVTSSSLDGVSSSSRSEASAA